jgi:uncharacterized damage-inducible protein DinB
LAADIAETRLSRAANFNRDNACHLTLTACHSTDTACHFSSKFWFVAEYCSEQHETLREAEEFYMKKFLTRYGVCALAVALVVSLANAQAQAQPVGVQAAFAKDAGTLSDKFTALARVMSGKYEWKPGEGVRSVGEVFNLIVTENGLLAGVLSGTPSAGAKSAPITDPEKMQEALKTSYANLQKAITGLSDSDLQTPVKLFGRDMTKQAAVMLILGDQHEHLGQSIAYARTNGVVPPWSK